MLKHIGEWSQHLWKQTHAHQPTPNQTNIGNQFSPLLQNNKAGNLLKEPDSAG